MTHEEIEAIQEYIKLHKNDIPSGLSLIPTEQLEEIHKALESIVKLGQTNLNEFLVEDSISDGNRRCNILKRAIFNLAEFPAMYAKQWINK